jgi:hypothetical protein
MAPEAPEGDAMTVEITDPAVRRLVDAINAGDRDAFFDALAPDASMSDDGTDRDLAEWVDREIFSANGSACGTSRPECRGPASRA